MPPPRPQKKLSAHHPGKGAHNWLKDEYEGKLSTVENTRSKTSAAAEETVHAAEKPPSPLNRVAEGRVEKKSTGSSPPPSPKTSKRLAARALAYFERAGALKNLFSNILPEEIPLLADDAPAAEFNAFPDHCEAYGKDGDHPPQKVPYKTKRTVKFERHNKEGYVDGEITTINMLDYTDEKNPVHIGIWARKNWIAKHEIKPGMVIKATHAYANNDISIRYPSDYVRIFSGGPVYSKARPMVVLWQTESGMVCVPMYSLMTIDKETKEVLPPGSALEGFTKERREEFIHLTTTSNKEWKGEILASFNGRPLLMDVHPGVSMNDISFVDISRTIWISRFEHFETRMAMLTPLSYVRLMDAVAYREHARKSSFLHLEGYQLLSTMPLEPTSELSNAQKARWMQMGVTEEDIDREDLDWKGVGK